MIQLDADTYLIRAGDPPTCGYLIERGTVEVILERDGGDHVVAVLGPGELVGEMALIDGAPRAASVRSREACLLLPITAESITKRLASADPLLQLVLGTVLDRLRSTLKSASSSAPSKQEKYAPKSAITAAATAELRLAEELAFALDNDQIVVHYQPIVRLSDERLIGFEALARWAHPQRGLVPPGLFVPLAEAAGLSGRLSQVCLTHVMRDLAAIDAAAAGRPKHVEEPRVAINISGYDLQSLDLVHKLSSIVKAARGSLNRITLELTETALVQSPSEAAAKLEDARRLGFKIAIDDFGTGYSSLNYIRTLPVDILKIDRAFVQSVLDCDTTRSIVVSMIHMAKALNLSVVAEGIETAEHRVALQKMGCDYGQGYLFGRPLPTDQTLACIKSWQSGAGPAAITCASAA